MTASNDSQKRRTFELAADIVAFKISWIALVLFQEKALFPVLLILVLKIVTWRDIARFLPLIFATFLLGIAMDFALMTADAFIFPDSGFPLWLILLWVSFALTLPRGFSFVGRMQPLMHARI